MTIIPFALLNPTVSGRPALLSVKLCAERSIFLSRIFLGLQKAREYAAAADASLAARSPQTLVDRSFQAAKTRRDGLGRMSGGQQAQNLQFAVCKPRQRAERLFGG
jgi:hypothetical protein